MSSTQLYLRTLLSLFLSALSPWGPGCGPDCHFPEGIGVPVVYLTHSLALPDCRDTGPTQVGPVAKTLPVTRNKRPSKPCEFKGSGAVYVAKPHKFI